MVSIHFSFKYLTLQMFKFFQKLYSEFEMHGMEPDKLNSQHWQLVDQRMQTEEASCVLCQGDQAPENG